MAKIFAVMSLIIGTAFWYGTRRTVVLLQNVEETSAIIIRAEAPKKAQDPRTLNYAFQAILAKHQEKIADPFRGYLLATPNAPERKAFLEKLKANPEATMLRIRAELRDLPLDTAFEEKRTLLSLVRDEFAKAYPKEATDIGVDSLQGAVKQASTDLAEQERTGAYPESHYGTVDTVYYSLNLLLALPLEPQTLSKIANDAAKSTKDQDTKHMIARTLNKRFPAQEIE